MMKFPRHALKAAGSACLFFLAQPALAQEQEITVTANMKVPEGLEVVKLIVSLKDLDLATIGGANRMEKRVGAVINRFCAPPPRAARWQLNDSKDCSNIAWASARPQMDAALRKAKGG